MNFILVPFLVALSSCLHLVHGDCRFTTDVVTQNFTIREDASSSTVALRLYVSDSVTSVDTSLDPINTKYFTIKFTTSGSGGTYYIYFTPISATLPKYFEENDSELLRIRNLKLLCSGGDEHIEPEIHLVIEDYNNKPPKFPVSSGTFDVHLPYHGAPINWDQFIMVTDADFDDANTKLTFYTNYPGLIDLDNFPVERVPADPSQRLQYYKLYFGLTSTWTEEGMVDGSITAVDTNSLWATYVVHLNVQKDCKFVTNIGQTFVVPEDAPVDEPAITIDVEFVETIDTTFDPINDKYFSFEFDIPAQKIYLKPKPTLATYFDQNEDGKDTISLLNLNLICIGVTQTAPKINIRIQDVDDKPPKFEPSSATYYPSLPNDGKPINFEQFIKVTDADFLNEHTALTFSHDRSDLITLTPSRPERVPADPAKRLEYYKLYFSLQPSWTVSGVEVVTISAQDGAGHVANFTASLDVTRCILNTDLSQGFTIPENIPIDQPAITLDVEGVTDIDSSFDPINDQYFWYNLDVPVQKIYVMPRTTLATYYDNPEAVSSFTINGLTLTCARALHFEPTIKIVVQDVNDRSPEFDPPSQSYDVALPYFGAPINWHQFIAVRDADFLEMNTNLTFTIDRSDLIDLTPGKPERVPANVVSRLEYYKLYFSLQKTWDSVGIQDAVVRATDEAGNFGEFHVSLNITMEQEE